MITKNRISAVALVLLEVFFVPSADARPEAFPIDRAHSVLDFEVTVFGLTKVRGTIERYHGTIVWDEENPTQSSVTAMIDISSIRTGDSRRDEHLQHADFFDAENHPSAMFQSKRLEETADGFRAMGPLTIRGVTRNIAIPFRVLSPVSEADPWQNRRVTFAGTVTLDRHDFGIEGGGWGKSISDEVTITLVTSGRIYNYERWFLTRSDKPSIGTAMLETLGSQSGSSAVSQFHRLKAEKPDDFDFTSRGVFVVGLRMMQKGRSKDALAIFDLVESLPELEKMPISLELAKAQALVEIGDDVRAIEAFRKVVAGNPSSTYAIEMLRRLGSD